VSPMLFMDGDWGNPCVQFLYSKIDGRGSGLGAQRLKPRSITIPDSTAEVVSFSRLF
jgi:hypothetical protein